jgi:hypothetical protein
MNILIDGLPTAIEVDGHEYEINADYQTGLRIITAFEDGDLTVQERCAVMVNLLYKEQPANFQEAVRMGIIFLDGGKDPEEKSKTMSDGNRYYSFLHDAGWIYAGVDRVLQGRLNRGDFVHWWEFITAFMELPEDCMMSRILYLRQQYVKGKLTKEERKLWYEMRDTLELPVELTEQERAAQDEFMRLLEKQA